MAGAPAALVAMTQPPGLVPMVSLLNVLLPLRIRLPSPAFVRSNAPPMSVAMSTVASSGTVQMRLPVRLKPSASLKVRVVSATEERVMSLPSVMSPARSASRVAWIVPPAVPSPNRTL